MVPTKSKALNSPSYLFQSSDTLLISNWLQKQMGQFSLTTLSHP